MSTIIDEYEWKRCQCHGHVIRLPRLKVDDWIESFLYDWSDLSIERNGKNCLVVFQLLLFFLFFYVHIFFVRNELNIENERKGREMETQIH